MYNYAEMQHSEHISELVEEAITTLENNSTPVTVTTVHTLLTQEGTPLDKADIREELYYTQGYVTEVPPTQTVACSGCLNGWCKGCSPV